MARLQSAKPATKGESAVLAEAFHLAKLEPSRLGRVQHDVDGHKLTVRKDVPVDDRSRWSAARRRASARGRLRVWSRPRPHSILVKAGHSILVCAG